MTAPASEWAIALFGAEAESVATAVVGGLHAAHARALRAHDGGGLRTADAYGGVLWLAATEEILTRIAQIDGTRSIKPDCARYSLGVVNNNVVYPVRFAADLRTPPTQAKLPMSKVKEDLFSLGPAPSPRPEQHSLFDALTVDDAEDTTLEDTAGLGEAGLIVVAYVSSWDGGLMAAWWGGAALLEDGQLDWQHIEKLDLSRTEAVTPRPDLRLVATTDERDRSRFSDAPLQETPLGVCNPLITPVSEPQAPDTPTGSGDDES